jgi:hypothetical protein
MCVEIYTCPPKNSQLRDAERKRKLDRIRRDFWEPLLSRFPDWKFSMAFVGQKSDAPKAFHDRYLCAQHVTLGFSGGLDFIPAPTKRNSPRNGGGDDSGDITFANCDIYVPDGEKIKRVLEVWNAAEKVHVWKSCSRATGEGVSP